jgi:hypothetical protein
MLKQSDPKLKGAMEEIIAVMKKYDIGGHVALASGKGHSQYLNFVTEPTWSCLTREGKGVRFKAKKEESERANATFNMIDTLFNVTKFSAMGYGDLISAIKEQYDVIEGPVRHSWED